MSKSCYFKIRPFQAKWEKILLWTGIFINLFCCFCSFSNPQGKISHAFWHYIWEFFTTHWCVWNSLLNIFYNIKQIRNKKASSLGIVVATSNLITAFLFSLVLWQKPELIGNRGLMWWIYSILWHYFVPLFSLTYFFVFSEIKKVSSQKKNSFFARLFFLSSCQPVFFFIANFFRNYIISFWYWQRGEKVKYLGDTFIKGKKLTFKKFMFLPFKWVEKWIKQKFLVEIIFFTIIALSLFSLMSSLLLWIKIKFFRYYLISRKNNSL